MTASSLVGRKFAGFIVDRELGAGGMGMVVLARQESLDRPAVLKRIHPQLDSDAELEARFEREAITAARLHHPNVVGVYDRFHYRGDPYIATEYVDGIDLAGILSSEKRLPWRIAATIALEVARGLEAIHAAGTLHRDIKPQNILVGRHGQVKITDFGLALDPSGTALTQPGIAVGTPPYMAPEQLRGDRVDPRADLFSFGCVLYEMLVDSPPYRMSEEGENEGLLARVESGRYPRVRGSCRDAPRGLVRLVRSCLQPKAPKRVASAMEGRRRLEALLGRPSGADCQATLAAFLWDRHVFASRSTETVVMVARPAVGRSRKAARLGLAAAAMALAMGVVGVSVRDPNRIVRWTESLTRSVSESDVPVALEPSTTAENSTPMANIWPSLDQSARSIGLSLADFEIVSRPAIRAGYETGIELGRDVEIGQPALEGERTVDVD